MEHLVKEIESRLEFLKNKGFYTKVEMYKNIFQEDMISIDIASSEKWINGVKNQMPDHISYSLSKALLLQPQTFCGNGGGSVYRNIDPNNPKESWLAMGREKIPFRKPQQNETAVLKAIDKIVFNYVKILLDIKERGLLRYGDLADYDKLLN
jgi:hypothetical protein